MASMLPPVMLTLPEAKEEFQDLLRKLRDPHNQRKLIDWIKYNWREGEKKYDLVDAIELFLRGSFGCVCLEN